MMLTKKQKEYLESPEKFEDEHGLEYARTCRHRIRKKVENALDTILFVIKKGKVRDSPAKNYYERKKEGGTEEKPPAQEQSPETPSRPPKKQREKRLVNESKVAELAERFAQRDKWDGKILQRAVERGLQKER